MSPTAGFESPSDGSPATMAVYSSAGSQTTTTHKDKVIEWYRGEFAAANAIIDALCHHVVQLAGGGGDGGTLPVPSDYEAAFAAIHRRRMNWIPVLQMQKYFTIAEVSEELRKAADGRRKETPEKIVEEGDIKGNENGGYVSEGEDSPDSEITDTGCHEVRATLDITEICDNHELCSSRREQIKITKGFVAKEPVKGHMMNVVKGLKMYEDIFTDSELSKLNDFVDELRAAGQNGELLGETYILFNQQMKGNKREQIQLGVPIFGQMKDTAMSKEQKPNNEEIPGLLQSVIDHLVQWHILPENRKPNGCIIHYYYEGEYSQPYIKPPHVDQPICTLLLSESTMAFGRTLVNDGDGNFTGKLMLCLKEGSLLVMRNHSADIAKHAICTSPTRRVAITFFRVRTNTFNNHHLAPPLAPPLMPALWQPSSLTTPSDVIPVVHAPLVMLSPMVTTPRCMSTPQCEPGSGTGVFLPWAVGSRRATKHLPPRSQKGRFLSFPCVQA